MSVNGRWRTRRSPTIAGFEAKNPDPILTVNRSDLEQSMTGAKTLDAQIAGGTAKIHDDASVLAKLASTMVDFDPLNRCQGRIPRTCVSVRSRRGIAEIFKLGVSSVVRWCQRWSETGSAAPKGAAGAFRHWKRSWL
jgi:Alkyl sulfatase C-terminal